jgi:outer membrane receptor protein involved in Fe transport
MLSKRVYISIAATLVCQSILALHATDALAQDATASGAAPPNSQAQPTPAASEDLRGQPTTDFDFKAPPGSLGNVLDAITAQSGAKYRTYSSGLLGVQSPGVSGRMSLHEAVVLALKGTGWRVVSLTNGEIRLAREAGAAGATDLGAIVVTARRQAFKENFSSAATMTNTPLHETPATVDVVPQDIIQSENIYSLSEAIRNIPGAVLEESGGSYQINFGPTSTGGAQGGITFTDGLRNGSLAQNEPTVLLDSVEVLKGPASLLTGTEVGGGLLNYVPKRANGITPTEVSAGYGSGNEWTLTGDVSAAIPGAQGLYFRVIGLAQHGDDNPAGGNRPSQYVINPMLGYRSDNTKFDLNFEYFSQQTPFAREDFVKLPSTPVSVVNVPIQSYGSLYNPNNLIQTSFSQFGYNFEHTLVSSADWTLELRGKGIYQTGSEALAVGVPAEFAGPFVVFVSLGIDEPQTTSSHHVDLYSKFSTGPLEHQFIVGGDYSLVDDHRAIAVLPAFEMFGAAPPPLPEVPYSEGKDDDQTEEYGIVFQDQITWGRVHALIGERGSWFNDRSTPFGNPTTTNAVSQWTPNLGLVVDVTKVLSVYGSYNQAFSPQPAGTMTFSGGSIAPTLVSRYEAGLKASLFSDRLDLNGSYFSYTTSNSALDDPNPLHAGFSIAGPGESSQGLELSAQGALSRSVKLTAGYTYTTGTFVDGQPIQEAPKNVANLWVVKTFNVGDRSKIDVGFGGNYHDGYYIAQSGVLAPDTPTFTNTSGINNSVKFNNDFLNFDASLGYSLGKVRFDLTVDNLFGRQNYELSGGDLQLVRAEPRTFRLVVDAKF